MVDTLTTASYSEHEIAESPLLGPSGLGWNAARMHTLAPWWTGTNWLESADGEGMYTLSIGIYTTAPVLPEFPSQIILPLFIVVTLIFVYSHIKKGRFRQSGSIIA